MVLCLTSRIVKSQVLPICRQISRSTVGPFQALQSVSFQRPRSYSFSTTTPSPSQIAVASPTTVTEAPAKPAKRKPTRLPPGKRSLRRVAAEAERSREQTARHNDIIAEAENGLNGITAICVAEEFDMDAVVRILRSRGYPIDPHGTGFLNEQVVHTRSTDNGDIFVFPSGTVVSWSLPELLTIDLATSTLRRAAINPHPNYIEMEDLEYREDPSRDYCGIKGDVITLGTRLTSQEENPSLVTVDTTLAKIAFSSGLARSTKLAVLESMLSKYFESTRSIPTLLSNGSRLPFSRPYILKKTGELLELRAQLNHYSELTDSLPDLFWDSKHALGLEGYYDQVGRALDIGIRIKTLNEKMNYALETGSILRETLSEKHGIFLEWIIILLIAVEVVFGLRNEYREWKVTSEKENISG